MVHVAVVIVQQVEFQFLGPGCTIVEGQRIEIACSIYTEGAEPAVGSVAAVSYTHLDVYKRQALHHHSIFDMAAALTASAALIVHTVFGVN